VPWFRWKKRGEPEEAPVAAAPPEPDAAAQAEAVRSEEAVPAKAEAKPAQRRRGSRAARSKKETPGEAAAVSAKDATRPASPQAGASKARSRQRRAATPKRATLPAVTKEILISVDVGERRVAVLEDGKSVEVYLERRDHRSIAGNVYKGIVDNVLPGMEASFVDIGLEKNGFLYVDEIVMPELEGKRGGRRIQDLVQRGQEVLVQAVKDPMGTKGARLTTEISLPGRFVVYVPYGEGIGVSRRLDDAERDRLKAICRELELPEGGIIVRTAAEGASRDEIEGDLELLQKLWAAIRHRAERAKAPMLVYQEAELPLRIIRDLFIRDFERVVVDHDRTYRRVVGYLRRTSRELAARVELYEGQEPLMQRAGVDEAVRSTLDRRVDLPSGGYLIFDYAEAFTVVDVNTGRFVGGRGKSGGARLEDTITKNNLEAVVEVVRQLRLRDVGGIIVIDFIDMANPKNRELVEEALRRELERDRTKTYVVEISPLGLVEMTRQNVTDGPREILTTHCPVCAGDGIVVSRETHAIDAERKLRRIVAASASEAFLIGLNDQIAELLVGSGGERLAEIEEELGRRFALRPDADVAPDEVTVLGEGSWNKVEPRDLPVAAGQELMVKLEIGRDQDAIARVDGLPIRVAGAAGKVGKRMKIRIARVTPLAAYAVLTSARRAAAPVQAEQLAEDEPETARREPRDAAQEAETAAPDEVPAAAVVDAAQELKPPRKKTRRGSRGGRARTKKAAIAGAETPVAAAAEAPPTEPAESTDEEAPLQPTLAEADGPEGMPDGGEKPKKRTRRGSRGGRARRKKLVAPDGAAVPEGVEDGAGRTPADGAETPDAAEAADEATAEPISVDGAEAPEAEPSEETKPKKRTRRGSRGGRGRGRSRAESASNGAEPEAPGVEADGAAAVEADGAAAVEADRVVAVETDDPEASEPVAADEGASLH
jgi:ribonuclease G